MGKEREIKILSVRMPSELHGRLSIFSLQEHRSMNSSILIAIEKLLLAAGNRKSPDPGKKGPAHLSTGVPSRQLGG